MKRCMRFTWAILLIAATKQQLIFLTNSSSTADAFSPLSRNSQSIEQGMVSRSQFIGRLLPVVLTLGTAPALAADDLKGTKKDPAYEACLSQCMYTCTKPKGEEQKSRTACLSECKQQCATTKQQLMLGTPIS